ncbi:MAG: ABC transporter substrate-binding protein [Cyanobacteria bacterium P01_F01_bin.13]
MEKNHSYIIFVLRIGRGTFSEGFPVTLQVFEAGSIVKESRLPDIPANAALPSHYQRWRSSYDQLGNTRKISPVAGQQTHGRLLEECRDATSAFEHHCEAWFQGFESLRKSIWAEAKSRSAEQVCVILDVNTGSHDQDTQLRKVPWHLWKLFDDDLPNSEMILNAGFSRSVRQFDHQVNILAIFGSAEGGLQLDKDLAALEQLESKGAVITALKQPNREQLHDHLWQRSWDVIAFAGHSASEAGYRQGHIQIRDDTSLPLSALKQDLKHAVEQGLKLAIFNSCDGLGIADYLTDLKVPIMIVMREPVPDLVARKFLFYFLESFSSGEPLHTAVRTSRKRLHWLESNDDELPCPAATWLPIICQNPNQPPLQWPDMSKQHLKPRSKTPEIAQKKTDIKLWITRGIVGLVALAAIIWAMKKFFGSPAGEQIAGNSTISSVITPKAFENRISQGEESLVANEAELLPESLCDPGDHSNFQVFKDIGTQQMASQNYGNAAASFSTAFALCPAPEVLIYQNNAEIAASGESPYTLAVSIPIGGASPSNALEMLRGMAQAQLEINDSEAKINGRPLQLLILDDEDNPQIAAEIANQLVDNYPEVLGVIGHWTSDVSLTAAAEYEQRKRLTFVTPISTTNELSDFSSWVFRSTINNRSGSRALADHMVNVWQAKKAAIFCVEGVTYSQEICAGFKRRLSSEGGEIVQQFNLGDPQLDIRKSLRDAKAKGAEVILLASNNASVARSLEIINANGGELKLLGDMANLYTIETLKEANAIGMVMAIAWHPDGPVNLNFVNESGKLWRGRTNYVTALSYGTTQAMVEAIRQAPSRAGVQAQLRDPEFKAPSPDAVPMTFGETGDRPAPVQLVEVQRRSPSLSGTGADFIPID